MDLFTRNRTFLILFGILVIFVIVVLQYFGKYFNENFTLISDYPEEWNDGMKINIKGNSNDGTSRYSNPDAAFRKDFTGKAKCNQLCKKQPECVDKGDKWKNNCESNYSPADRTCHCSFQKVEEFTSMNPFKRLCNEMQMCPSWPQDGSQWNTYKWTPLTKQTNITTWKEMNVPDINNISFSFWVYFDESLGENRPWTSLFQIAKPSYNGSENWQGSDRYIGVFAWPSRPALHVRTMTDENVNAGNGNEFSNEPNALGSYEIGYNANASFIVITFKNGICTFYRDGKYQNRSGKDPILQPEDDAKLMSGITYAPYHQDPKGISIKDFRVYDHAILGHDVEILYNQIQNKGWRESFQTIEGSMPQSTPLNVDTGNTSSKPSVNYMEASWQSKHGDVISTNYYVDKYKNESINEGFQIAAPIQASKIAMENLVLRSSTAQKCNRSEGGRNRANNQRSENDGKPVINKAVVHFRNGQSTDFTQLVQNTLNIIDQDPTNNIASRHNELLDSVRIEIHVIHSWSKELQKFVVEYSNYQEFNWKMLTERVKCLNRDDHQWDNANSKCNFTGQAYTCTSSAPTCVNYTSHIRWGYCSAANPMAYQTETVFIENRRKKKLQFVKLDGANEGHLDIVVDEEKEKEVMFGPNGTTISMWFRISPEKRKSIQTWARLLNFGNRNWRSLRDEVFIAIEGDMTQDRLVFMVDGNTLVKGSQMLNNEWHHIAWVMDKERSQWRIYHHGRPIGHSDNRPYPQNIHRQTKIVGGPGVDWDDFWRPDIADFRIYGKALEDKDIKDIYLENSVP